MDYVSSCCTLENRNEVILWHTLSLRCCSGSNGSSWGVLRGSLMVFNVFVLSLPTKLHSSKRQPPYYGLFSLMYAGICGNLIRAFSHSFYCFKLLFHSEAAVEKEEQNIACMRKNFWECKSVLRTDLLRTKTPMGTILPYPKKVITNGCFFI